MGVHPLTPIQVRAGSGEVVVVVVVGVGCNEEDGEDVDVGGKDVTGTRLGGVLLPGAQVVVVVASVGGGFFLFDVLDDLPPLDLPDLPNKSGG